MAVGGEADQAAGKELAEPGKNQCGAGKAGRGKQSRQGTAKPAKKGLQTANDTGRHRVGEFSERLARYLMISRVIPLHCYSGLVCSFITVHTSPLGNQVKPQVFGQATKLSRDHASHQTFSFVFVYACPAGLTGYRQNLCKHPCYITG